MSCDHELANEWAHVAGKMPAIYINKTLTTFGVQQGVYFKYGYLM